MEKEILYRFFRGETGPDEERRLMYNRQIQM